MYGLLLLDKPFQNEIRQCQQAASVQHLSSTYLSWIAQRNKGRRRTMRHTSVSLGLSLVKRDPHMNYLRFCCAMGQVLRQTASGDRKETACVCSVYHIVQGRNVVSVVRYGPCLPRHERHATKRIVCSVKQGACLEYRQACESSVGLRKERRTNPKEWMCMFAHSLRPDETSQPILR